MSIDIRVPDIGDFKDVPVIEVFVKVGDTVKAEDPLISLESDKATMDVPSPAAGTVKEIKVKVGDSIGEGAVILLLEAEGAAAGPAAPVAPKAVPAPVAAPVAPSAPPPWEQAAAPGEFGQRLNHLVNQFLRQNIALGAVVERDGANGTVDLRGNHEEPG